ncbi:MAG: hypothetical protein IKM97_03910 [Clostridia bacterium]|nr:hypothetical protein [Clostridia bacterium]
MEDFKNDVQEIEEILSKAYDEVVTHEAEAIIELLLENLNKYTEMYKNRIEKENKSING